MSTNELIMKYQPLVYNPLASIDLVKIVNKIKTINKDAVVSIVLLAIALPVIIPISITLIASASCQPSYVPSEDIRLYAGRAYNERAAGCPTNN